MNFLSDNTVLRDLRLWRAVDEKVIAREEMIMNESERGQLETAGKEIGVIRKGKRNAHLKALGPASHSFPTSRPLFTEILTRENENHLDGESE